MEKCAGHSHNDETWVAIPANGRFLDAKYWSASQRSIAFDQATVWERGKKLEGPLRFASLVSVLVHTSERTENDGQIGRD